MATTLQSKVGSTARQDTHRLNSDRQTINMEKQDSEIQIPQWKNHGINDLGDIDEIKEWTKKRGVMTQMARQKTQD